MQIAAVEGNDLDAAYTVLLECSRALEAQGLMQWDPQYPSRSFFGEAVANNSLFALSDSRRICGVVVLNESQPLEWSAAAWRVQEPPFLVIHAFAIAPSLQGRGLGKHLLRFCEAWAKERSYTSIRLDAFSENSTALRFYERQDYVFRGEVQFASKPLGHQRYYCYEKSLVHSGQRVQPNNSVNRTLTPLRGARAGYLKR
jgi:ribosomal protein S18 acetylase RimI-like enzyme